MKRGLIAGLVLAVAAFFASSTGGAQVVVGQPFIGAKISRSTSFLNHSLAVPLSFDVQRFDQGGNFYNPTQPDRVTIAVAGCYFVEAQITVLGSAYNLSGQWAGTPSNPASPDWLIEIRRNGLSTGYVAASRLTDENPGVAQLNSASTVECFAVGEFVQVFVTGNRVVESNWPNSGGSISPVLLVVYLGSLTP